jgi:DEAD/DEAH box helicase domain-containing protein
MNDILSIDIETKNLSSEIGGWNNLHMFKVACATTWDGTNGIVYIDKELKCDWDTDDSVVVKSLRQLKYDLDDHYQKGGVLLGHNINAFDLPVLRDSMDIYITRKYLQNKHERCIDTSAYITKEAGKRVHLDNLCKCTLNEQKIMESVESVYKWRDGKYDEVAEYCLKDSQLTYDLWDHGRKEGFVKFYDEMNDKFIKTITDW